MSHPITTKCEHLGSTAEAVLAEKLPELELPIEPPVSVLATLILDFDRKTPGGGCPLHSRTEDDKWVDIWHFHDRILGTFDSPEAQAKAYAATPYRELIDDERQPIIDFDAWPFSSINWTKAAAELADKVVRDSVFAHEQFALLYEIDGWSILPLLPEEPYVRPLSPEESELPW